MDVFFSPIIDGLKSLEIGEIFDYNNSQKYLKGYVLFAVFDKPARSSILNMNSSNGFYGCLKCTQPGQTIKNKNGIFNYCSNPLV